MTNGYYRVADGEDRDNLVGLVNDIVDEDEADAMGSAPALKGAKVHSRKHVLRKSKSSLRKMDSKVLKRGRPKGAEQTVIGLPAKWKCFTKPVAFCKKDPLQKTENVSDVRVATGGQSGRGRCSLGAITVEPIVFLFMLAFGLVEPTTQAFIYYKPSLRPLLLSPLLLSFILLSPLLISPVLFSPLLLSFILLSPLLLSPLLLSPLLLSFILLSPLSSPLSTLFPALFSPLFQPSSPQPLHSALLFSPLSSALSLGLSPALFLSPLLLSLFPQPSLVF
ncbi:hypothetical protein NP493_195g03022 [Ridgeia piscesae]|uniref:Uncharacterized protein n=1 Tax=Ridgeia piscesae TaxID=27915 RepID=A0AAD9UEQ0_RIDPI|nr:hypothetical protein NP493_195g03022 [Ridgeia piscesae]